MRWDVTLEAAVGAVLLAAAAAKLRSPAQLRTFLTAWGLPAGSAGWLVRAVAVAEAACGLLLLTGRRPLPALVAVALSIGFVAVTAVSARSGIGIGCGCFGALDGRRSTPVTVARAGALAVAALALLAAQLDRPEQVAVWSADQRGAAVVGLLAASVYVLSFALLGSVYEFSLDRPRPRVRRTPEREGTSH